MEWGNRLEQVIAEKYGEETGRKTRDPGRFMLLRSREYPFLVASIDRWIALAERKTSGILEIKTAHPAKAKEWEKEPPLDYQVQLAHQFAVTGAKWGSLAVLIGGQKFRWADVERNDEFIVAYLKQANAFWGMVAAKTPPEPDAHPATARALQLLYPQPLVEAVALPAEAAEWDAQLQEIKNSTKLLGEKKAELENKLKAAIGEAERGVLPDGTAYNWKLVEKKEHMVGPANYRHLTRREAKNNG